MDGEPFRQLYHRLFHENIRDACVVGRRCTYCDAIVALVYLYAAFCDRSPRWASDKRNWPIWARRLKLPCYSQLMRRLKTAPVRWLIAQLSSELRDLLPRSSEKVLDSKPLVVGGFSKDPDTAVGKVPDGWARGYRTHVLIDACGAIESFIVTAMNEPEPVIALDLIQRADLRGTVVRGDSGYDSNPLYGAVADAGARLIAARKKPGTALGHHPQHPDRVAAVAELENPKDDTAAKAAKRHRNRVEQTLAHVTNLPFGLSPLPNFVRRLWRVRLWLMAKIVLYHQHLVLQQSLTAAA